MAADAGLTSAERSRRAAQAARALTRSRTPPRSAGQRGDAGCAICNRASVARPMSHRAKLDLVALVRTPSSRGSAGGSMTVPFLRLAKSPRVASSPPIGFPVGVPFVFIAYLVPYDLTPCGGTTVRRAPRSLTARDRHRPRRSPPPTPPVQQGAGMSFFFGRLIAGHFSLCWRHRLAHWTWSTFARASVALRS